VRTASAIVLTSPDGIAAHIAAVHLSEAGIQATVRVLSGGTAGWNGAGYDLETGLSREKEFSKPIDVYKRPYEGTDNAREAMKAYLDWEYGLVDQLERDGTHGFVILK
jgi:3-mercaptopyruvate sulfurtransferase SseA